MIATLIGATGLIGNYLLDEMLKDDFFDTTRILIRRPIELTHPKLEKKVVNFDDTESFRLALERSNVVFCTIGTTQKKVKNDKMAYRKVDFNIPVNAAMFCKMNGCEKFILVSSVGADSKSNNFYLKIKGEVEDAVNNVARQDDTVGRGLKSVHIMRPSLLLGERKEFRLGENISEWIMPVFSFLIPSKYKPIHGRDVAKAMLATAKKNDIGFIIHEYSEIKQISTNI